MCTPVVWSILSSKNKMLSIYPKVDPSDSVDILGAVNLGFAYIEHTDNLTRNIVASPDIAKQMIQDLPDFKICGDQLFIGHLWTAKVYVSEIVKTNQIFFSNQDHSVVLQLNLNNI